MKAYLALSVLTAYAALLAAPREARAGIADSPLPVLQAGKQTLYLYSVPGVINSDIGTFFSCTSTDSAPMQVGVELFFQFGGAPANDAAATSLTVNPGATVLFGTGAAAEFSIDSNLGGGFMSKGSSRILATSTKLMCTAFLADRFNAPPTSMAYLTVIKGLKQKAAN